MTKRDDVALLADLSPRTIQMKAVATKIKEKRVSRQRMAVNPVRDKLRSARKS